MRHIQGRRCQEGSEGEKELRAEPGLTHRELFVDNLLVQAHLIR